MIKLSASATIVSTLCDPLGGRSLSFDDMFHIPAWAKSSERFVAWEWKALVCFQDRSAIGLAKHSGPLHTGQQRFSWGDLR